MMKFTIHSCDKERVEKDLLRIATKADKYGVPFSFTFGENHPQKIKVREFDPVNKCMVVVGTYTVEAVDVEINADGLIKSAGWVVSAKIEHVDAGNIVTPFGCEAEEAWYSLEPRCDHCGTNRFRSVTFIVRNESGEVRQVGKTCLKDYTGIDPATAALWASVAHTFDDCSRDWDRGEWEGRFGKLRMWDVEEILAHACDEIKKRGYRKSDERDSTRERVAALVGRTAPSDDGVAKAREVIAWLDKNADEFKIGLERDCVALIRSGYAKGNHFGRLAYLPVAYEKWLDRKAAEEKRAAEEEKMKHSEYVGSVGERLKLTAASARLVTSWDTIYGTTHLYRFVDNDGNVFVWKSSAYLTVEDGMALVGTVKEHSEYNGVKQTVLTRCKAA